jgi:hypothetical protein
LTPQKAVPSDTASVDYLIYLLQNELPLNYNWTKKLEEPDMLVLLHDSMSRLEVNRTWAINDSVLALILRHSTGTSLDEFLLTVKDKKDLIGMVNILNNVDSDVSEERPHYYYTEYKQIDDRNIKVYMHKIENYDTNKQKDIIDSVQNWFIQNDGKVVKK